MTRSAISPVAMSTFLNIRTLDGEQALAVLDGWLFST